MPSEIERWTRSTQRWPLGIRPDGSSAGIGCGFGSATRPRVGVPGRPIPPQPGNIRFAFLAGIALWISWGSAPAALHPGPLRTPARPAHAVGVFIPMLVIGLALTFTPFFGRIWEWVAVAIARRRSCRGSTTSRNILTLPAEYGYVGVILITAFTYTLLRLRFVLVLLITLIGIGAYLPYAFTTRYVAP